MKFETHRVELLDGTFIDRHEIKDPEQHALPAPPAENMAEKPVLPVVTPIMSNIDSNNARPGINTDTFVTRTLSYRKWVITKQHADHPHDEQGVHFQDGYYIVYLWKTWVPAEAAHQFESAFNQAMEISEIG